MARLLVIEDDTACRELVVRVLRPCGHSVTAAENAEIGLATLAKSNVDLVITDLHMPGIEGLQAIREIRRLLPDVKIIAVSGSDPSDLHVAMQFGANAVIRKPYQLADLRGTVAKLLSEFSADSTPEPIVEPQPVRMRSR